jgi:tetratricopeptide (TPR) repeat protein
MKHHTGACPDPETLAGYLDGRLSGSDRDRVVAHLADCEDCYFVFAESVRTLAVAPPVSRAAHMWRTAASAPAWGKAAAAVASLAAAAMLTFAVQPQIASRWWPGGSDVADLVTAVGTARTFEPRLTGGFAYGQVRGALRAGDSSVVVVSPDVRIAAARIEKAAIARPTPQMLHSVGIASLVVGDVARAVSVLEQAADQAPPEAPTLTDLSAAYLTRAARNRDRSDLLKALALADRAIKSDPQMVEALFNRALALERLSLVREARDAWRDYLKIDGGSGWAGEARSHLRALS